MASGKADGRSNKVGRGADQFALRMPDGLRDQIRAAAEANGRSMNAEIVARLAATEQDITPEEITRLRQVLDQQSNMLEEISAELIRRDQIIREQNKRLEHGIKESSAISRLLPPAGAVDFLTMFFEAVRDASRGNSEPLDKIIEVTKKRLPDYVDKKTKMERPEG